MDTRRETVPTVTDAPPAQLAHGINPGGVGPFAGISMPTYTDRKDGYVLLWRKIKGNAAWWKPPALYLMLHCMIEARHKPGTWKGIALERGQLITGRHTLLREIPFTEKQIRGAMQFLEQGSFLARKRTNKYSVITVCNYDSYQTAVPQEGQAKGPTEGKQRASRGPQTKNGNECKEGNTPLTPQGGTGKGSHRSKSEKQQDRVAYNTTLMVTIGGWFRRRPDTTWLVTEAAALERLGNPPPDLEIIGRYYSARIAPDRDYRRRDLPTLLNNWAGEADRARGWESEQKRKLPNI